MDLIIFVRYLHFISLFGVVACLVSEYCLIKQEMTAAEVKKVFKIDGLYGLMAILVVAAGLILWFGIGKPPEYYTKNPVFHIKVGLYIIVGLLSLYPTRFLWKYRKLDEQERVTVPGKIKKVIMVELIILFLIPLLASTMAQGVGISG